MGCSKKVQRMSFVTWIVAGALLGWAASALAGSGDRRRYALSIAVGIAGVLFGGWLLGLLIGASAFEPGEFGLGSFLVSLLGAAVLLAVLHEFRGIVAGLTATLRDGTMAESTTAKIRNRYKLRESK
jgi:uncharacterized membrane protein YeaQ/YmgE (transglycosylase-associated protein family)